MSTIPTTAHPSVPVPAQRPGWFTRNWKWFIPCGCATILVLFVAFICAIVGIVMVSMKSSDVYSMALQKAQSNEQVVQRLGAPIDAGWWASGNINVQPGSGNADMRFPISGPKGKATLYVEATKALGQWNFSNLVVAVEGRTERLDLIKKKIELEAPAKAR